MIDSIIVFSYLIVMFLMFQGSIKIGEAVDDYFETKTIWSFFATSFLILITSFGVGVFFTNLIN